MTDAVTAATGIVIDRPCSPGEAVADVLREDDVGAPPDGGDGRQCDAHRVHGAAPGLGQQQDPRQRQRRPHEQGPAAAAQDGDAQWTEELDRHCGAEGDPLDRGQEAGGDQACGHAEGQRGAQVRPSQTS
jgi:hypothetical protein